MEYVLYDKGKLVEYCANYAMNYPEICRLVGVTDKSTELVKSESKWFDGRNALNFSNPENGLSILVVNS